MSKKKKTQNQQIISPVQYIRDVLNFYYEKREDTSYYDAELMGMMMGDLLDIKATELLPEIKKLFDTDLVDEMCSGDYKDVESEMSGLDFHCHNDYELLNIYERYDELVKFLK
jgi:hypothetical protein